MALLNLLLKLCSVPSYFAIILLLDFLRLKILSFVRKESYDLNDFRFRYRNLTAKDGSKAQLVIFLIILFSTILTSPFFIDLLQIENLYLKTNGTYSYLVQYPAGDTYPAQIKKNDGKYFVEKVYLDDSYCIAYEEEDNEVKIGKPSYVSVVGYIDSDNITLLNKHVFYEKIKETDHVNILFGLLFCFLVLSDVFAIIVYHPKEAFNPKKYMDEILESYK